MIDFKQASFIMGAAALSQLPPDEGVEVAFVGRSNAGKSSALNTLCQQKSLARTSKTPGRTQQINLFALTNSARLVDLPGYGYAKVSKTTKAQWQRVLNQYLETRRCLKGLVLLMDSRHPLKEMDHTMVSWCIQCNLPCHILLSKADKLTQKERAKHLRMVEEAYQDYELVTVQLFSSLKKQGLEKLTNKLHGWYGKT